MMYASYFNRDVRLTRLQFAITTSAALGLYFAIVWLGAAAFGLLAGVHPAQLTDTGSPWPMLSAVWYGLCGISISIVSGNLFFNRLNDTSMSRHLDFAIWAMVLIGTASSIETAFALMHGRLPTDMYWEVIWSGLSLILGLPRTTGASDANASPQGRSRMQKPDKSTSIEALQADEPIADWVQAATARIAGDRDEIASGRALREPIVARPPRTAPARAFGRRGNLRGAT